MTLRTSCPDRSGWSELLDGQLPAKEQADLSRHLDACPDCQQTLEGLTAADERWAATARSVGQEPRPSSPALRRVIADLKAAGGDTTGPAGPATDSAPGLPFLRPAATRGHLGRLGAYEVIEVIGRGGMGVVLKALDPALQRLVAIKVLAPQWATSASARQRFEREGRATAAVSHDHVVPIYAVEEVDGVPYLVMEYVPGVSLQQQLDRRGPLELAEIVRIGMQTASGLAAAHEQGLIHRDVKPANILLQDGVGRVKLSDFGLARAVDDASLTQTGVIAGTPQYMAPEQARGSSLDHRADLFSLGSVLYAMCTGRPPFRAPSTPAVLKRVCDDTPHPIRDLNPAIPDWLVGIIDTLHAKDPADRFQSADEVARVLGQYLRHLRHPTFVGVPRRPPRRARPWRLSRQRWLVLLAGLVVLGALVALGGWFAFSSRSPFRAGRGTSQGGADEPLIVLSNARLVHKGLSHIEVDYRIPGGALPAGSRYIWVVQSPGGVILQQPFVPPRFGTAGTLHATRFIPFPQLAAGGLETYLVIDTPGALGGQRERISNTVSINR